MKNEKLNKVENISLMFFDNFRSTDDSRNVNIKLLQGVGFSESGAYSTSGSLILFSQKTQYKIVFGKRCNLSSSHARGIKYFSLAKVYKDKSSALREFKILVKNMECQDKKSKNLILEEINKELSK